MEWVPGVTPVDDDWPILALEIRDKAIRLYDEQNVTSSGSRTCHRRPWAGATRSTAGSTTSSTSIKRSHDVGVCPVVRYRDRWLLEGEEQFGIVEPLLTIQGRIDETTYEMSVSQYFTAFAQRWVAGWRPQNEAESLAIGRGRLVLLQVGRQGRSVRGQRHQGLHRHQTERDPGPGAASARLRPRTWVSMRW